MIINLQIKFITADGPYSTAEPALEEVEFVSITLKAGLYPDDGTLNAEEGAAAGLTGTRTHNFSRHIHFTSVTYKR